MRTFLEIRKKNLTYEVDQLVSGSSDEKIKPAKNVAKRPKGKYGLDKRDNGFAYVKTKTGKTGWIFLSKKMSSWGKKTLFKKVPGWG